MPRVTSGQGSSCGSTAGTAWPSQGLVPTGGPPSWRRPSAPSPEATSTTTSSSRSCPLRERRQRLLSSRAPELVIPNGRGRLRLATLRPFGVPAIREVQHDGAERGGPVPADGHAASWKTRPRVNRRPERITETPCRTGAADQPRADFTGRSRVVNTSPWPCGMRVAVPRDWARGRCSYSRNSPPVWSTPGSLRLITTCSGKTRSPYRSRCRAFQSPSPYLSRIAVVLVCPAAWHIASHSRRLSGQGAGRPSLPHQLRAIGSSLGYSASFSPVTGSGNGSAKYRYSPAPKRCRLISIVDRNRESSAYSPASCAASSGVSNGPVSPQP